MAKVYKFIRILRPVLYARIVEQAKAEQRSVNSMANILIERGLDAGTKKV